MLKILNSLLNAVAGAAIALMLMAPATGQNFLGLIPTDRLLGRDTAGTGQVEAITVGGGVEFTGSGAIQRSALTGDVTATAGSGTTDIAAGVVGTTEAAALDAGDTTTGTFADARVDGTLEEDELEPTLDTLANLTSVQGFTVTLDDPGFDALFGWDDSDGVYESLTLAEILTEAAPAAGDFVLVIGAEGDLRKSNWSVLPGGAAGGKQTVALLAGAGTVPSGGGTAGCTSVAAFDSGTNDVFLKQCSFSASADNALYWTIPAPKSSDETIDWTLRIDWTSATTTDATDDVIWTAAAVCFSNDDLINGNAFPAVDTATDTQTAAGDFLSSPTITAITPAGTWAENDVCVLKVTRDADAAGDNFNGTAELINAQLFITTNAITDD